MRKEQSDYGRTLRYLSAVPVVVGVALVVLCWIPYLAASLADVDVLHHFEKPTSFACTVYLWIGLLAPAAGIPIALRARKQTLTLADRGVRVEGRPVKLGSAVVDGLRPVTYAYAVGQEQRTVTMDVADRIARGYTRTSRVTVIYDPHDPANCKVLDVAAGQDLSVDLGETLKEGFSEVVQYAILAVVCFGSMAAMFALWHLLAGDKPGAQQGTALACMAGVFAGAAKIGMERWATRGDDVDWVRDFRTHYMVMGILLVAAISMFGWGSYENAEHDKFVRENAATDQQRKEQLRAAERTMGMRPSVPQSVEAIQPTGPNLIGTYKAVGESGEGQAIALFSNGGGTLTLALPDSANTGKKVLSEEDGRWVRLGDQLTFSLAATALGRRVPAKLLTHKFTIDADGRTLRRVDGLVFSKQP